MEIDYKKEYEAMVQRARELHETGNELTKRQMEIVCHELRESEDEKMLREIKRYIKEQGDKPTGLPNGTVAVSDMIDWLEKQKESLHIQETCKDNADSFTEASRDVIVSIKKYLDWLTGYPDYAPKGKYSIRDMLYCLSLLEKQKPENVSATTMAPSCWIEQQKEQNLAEWSEEDEKMLNLTKTQLRILQSHLSHTHSERMSDMEYSSRLLQIEKCVSWLDIRLKSLRPQPKAELTLLDENIIKAAVAFVEQNDHFNVWGGIDKHTVIKALRSLKPRWKPSKEQMQALNALNLHGDLSYVGQQNQLISLYQDLKKLM